MQETQVQSLNREDPLEKEMAAHSSILAWEIPWAEEPGGLQSMGSKKESHTHTHTHTKDGLVTTQPQMIALNFCSPPPNQNITCMPSPVVCLITEKLGGPAVLNLLYDIPKPAGPCSPKLLCLLIVRTVGESGC